MSHETFLTAKLGNDLASNMWINAKLSKAQISKVIQWGGFIGSCFGQLGKKVIKILGVSFSKRDLPGLVSNIASNADLHKISKFGKRISGKEILRAGKEFTLFISNEYTDVVIKVGKSFEGSNVFIIWSS